MKSKYNRINSKLCWEYIESAKSKSVPNSERAGGVQERMGGGTTISVNIGWGVGRWLAPSLDHLSPGEERWVWLFELERQGSVTEGAQLNWRLGSSTISYANFPKYSVQRQRIRHWDWLSNPNTWQTGGAREEEMEEIIKEIIVKLFQGWREIFFFGGAISSSVKWV